MYHNKQTGKRYTEVDYASERVHAPSGRIVVRVTDGKGWRYWVKKANVARSR